MAASKTNSNKEAITKENRHVDWSKIFAGLVAGIFGLYGMWCGIEYYSLCKIAVQYGTSMPDPELAVVCVSVVIAALLSYCLYQFGLKNSRNKYGIDSDGHPFKTVITDADDSDLGFTCGRKNWAYREDEEK